MLKNKFLLVTAIFVMLLALAACSVGTSGSSASEPPPANSSATVPDSTSSEPPPPSSSEVADSSSEPPPPSSSEVESSSEVSADTLISAHFEQSAVWGMLYWEIDVTDPDELAMIQGLMSTDDLSTLKKGDSRWTEGGSAILFKLQYGDTVVEGACNPHAPIERENNRSTLYLDETYYAFPQERGDKLLKWLKGMGLTIQG